MAVLDLDWGMPADAASARLGLSPQDRTSEQLAFSLGEVVSRLEMSDQFCPSLFLRLGDACNGRLHLAFLDHALVGVEIRYRFPFEAIGKSADGLSDLAMAAYARVILQDMLFEFIARYGAPAHVSEGSMRFENAHPVGMAVFDRAADGCLQVMVGHDGGGVVGSLRYLPSLAGQEGF